MKWTCAELEHVYKENIAEIFHELDRWNLNPWFDSSILIKQFLLKKQLLETGKQSACYQQQ